MDKRDTEKNNQEDSAFVDTQWLADHLNNPDIRIVDTRFLPIFAKGKDIADDCADDYQTGHLPGAVYLDCINDLSDTSLDGITPVPHSEQFAEVMSRAGIGNNTLVIVYDDAPLPLAAARLWWSLQYYGHNLVKILAGGLRQWVAENRPLTTEIPDVPRRDFIPKIRPAIRVTKEAVKAALDNPEIVLIDCLSSERYKGLISHPLTARDGHIPGAKSLPWLATGMGLKKAASNEAIMEAMVEEEPFHFLPVNELRDLFAQVGVKPDKRVITYCVKGYASCTVFLALKLIGYKDVAVYDASIAEWSRDPTLPMVKS
jgi:thiosulfate/3-mercaptopyruvate sulfurtransferase